MKRLSRIFSRRGRDSLPATNGIKRDETQEEILMRSDESDTEKNTMDANRTSDDHNNSNKHRLRSMSAVSAAVRTDSLQLNPFSIVVSGFM